MVKQSNAYAALGGS